jgi:hypothetical protein
VSTVPRIASAHIGTVTPVVRSSIDDVVMASSPRVRSNQQPGPARRR